MLPEIQAWLQFSLVALTSIFFIVDPIATVPSSSATSPSPTASG